MWKLEVGAIGVAVYIYEFIWEMDSDFMEGWRGRADMI